MEIIETIVAVAGRIRCITVPSASRKGHRHTVVLSCSCEGFQYVGHCYHLADAARVARNDARAQAVRTKVRLG